MSGEPLLRTARGHFVKGKSGYPGGRRPADFVVVQRMAAARREEVFAALDRALALGDMRAAAILLSYDVGKPATIVKIEGDIDIRVSDDLRKARARMQALGREIVEGVAEAVIAAEADEQP